MFGSPVALESLGFLADAVKSMLPIFVSYLAGYYILVMLLAFGWPGRMFLVVSLSTWAFYGFRHAINHHSLKLGGSVSPDRQKEAQEFVFGIFRKKGVNR